MTRGAAGLLALAVWTSGPAWAADPSRAQVAAVMERALDRASLRGATWSVEVRSLDTGRVVYARDPRRSLEPASTLKLITTAAALDALGPDTRIRTSLETAAPVDTWGRVLGDVLLVGRGDPSLGSREIAGDAGDPLEALADGLVGAGVRRIEGRLVGHEGLFPGERRGADWAWEDLVWGYGAEVSALSYADNCVALEAAPGAAVGDPVRLSARPGSSYYAVESTAVTSAGGEEELVLERDPGSSRIRLSGSLPRGAGAWSGCVALEDPARWTTTRLAEALAARGVTIAGGIATSTAPVPEATRVLAAHDGARLGDIVAEVDKKSLNLQAEMLLRLVGAHASGSGTAKAGHEAMQAFLDRIGVERDGWDLRDGSGLSRANLVTAHGLVDVLTALAVHPHAEVFRQALAVAGHDGTLAHRLRGTPAEGRLVAKTGTQRNVGALAGYLTTRHGSRLAFAVLVAHHTLASREAAAAIDAAVAALAGS